MATVTLQHLAKQMQRIEAMAAVNDWVPEEEAAKQFGMSAKTLSRFRNDYAHRSGWKYIGVGVDVVNRTKRRHIIWSKQYILENIFTNVA